MVIFRLQTGSIRAPGRCTSSNSKLAAGRNIDSIRAGTSKTLMRWPISFQSWPSVRAETIPLRTTMQSPSELSERVTFSPGLAHRFAWGLLRHRHFLLGGGARLSTDGSEIHPCHTERTACPYDPSYAMGPAHFTSVLTPASYVAKFLVNRAASFLAVAS
jgi:hypothetical protein